MAGRASYLSVGDTKSAIGRSVSLRGGWTLGTQVIGPSVSLVLGFCGLWTAARRQQRELGCLDGKDN